MAKRFELSLMGKGLLLVAFPLLCELIFVGYLLHVLHESEEQRLQAEHARAIVTEADKLLRLIYDAGAELVPYTNHRTKSAAQRYQEILDQMTSQYDLLCKLAGDNQSEQEVLRNFGPALSNGVKMLTTVKQSLESGEDSYDALMAVGHHRKQLFELSHELHDKMNALTKPEEEIAKISPEKQRITSERIRAALWLGLALNIVVAMGLARYFSKQVVDRLNIITENTFRVASDAPLNERLGGTDEIAKLDSIFHNMADSLNAARRRERAVVDNALDIICTLDLAYKFVTMNSACKPIWGYEPDNLLGTSLQKLISAEDFTRITEFFDELKQKGKGSFECKVKKADGSYAEMLWSIQHSELEGLFFSVVHDVSAEREVERMKQQFLAMVSHDLRTPLNSVLNLLTLVGEGTYGDLDSTGKKRITAAEEDVQRLVKLINELLQLERLDAGKMRLELSEVYTEDLVRRALNSVQAVADEKLIRFDTSVDEQKVTADPDKIVQVLVNLISNAVKASDSAQTIRIEGKRAGSMVAITVEDHGCGIPKEKQRTIFEPFEQLSQNGSKEGFGLGLAICRRIVEGHSGELTLESELGQGSKFKFTLPRVG
jgi:PAS domain S-box-containing protein